MKALDKEIQELFKKNEQAAFEVLFVKYYKPLCVAAKLYTSGSPDSEDLVQQLFIKFWEEKHFRKINTSYQQFLQTSLRNACFNHLDKEKTRHKRLQNAASDATIQEAIHFILQEEETRIFEMAYAELPEQSRKVFELVYFSDHSYKSAAEKLKLSVNTIKSHLKTALLKLRSSKTIKRYYLDE